jgi:prepilin-type N-terminal cleavage/methylation domain-containing protein
MTRRLLRDRDGGFTLVELLVTIVILGVIALPLANVVINYFLNSSTATARMGESHDEQIAATYWQQDVSSLGVRGAYDSASGTFPTQSSVNTTLPCTLPSGTLVISLSWNQYDASGNATSVAAAYLKQGTSLIRVHCTGSTVDSTATVAHDLAATPTCNFGSGAVACSSGSGTPSSITLNLSVSDPSGKGQPYSIALTGQRRQT